MTWTTAVNAAGGLALFVLAMGMMTDGLRAFAGGSLRRLLERWTSSATRGVFAGMLVTGLVQHSGAVTVAVIGFVNAGLLSLRQGLGVVFGSNIGTTMTGWLVSIVGFGVQVDVFALPILALGVVLRLTARGNRAQGLGGALAGFGLFFLGLSILQDAFAEVAETYGTRLAIGPTGGLPTYVLGGFIATVLTQSSSASLAIVLTAAARGLLPLDAAAAAVIGANLGSTSTAALAALRATPSARRLALGHIAFNLVTAAVALSILPLLLWAVAQVADWLDVEGSPAAVLALFHTVFNVLGVLLLLPLTGALATALERLFRSAEEDLSRPQHLDATLRATPDIAVGALHQELLRMRSIITEIVHSAMSGRHDGSIPVERRIAAAQDLGAAVARFVSGVGRGAMAADVEEELARALRTSRYLEEAARLATQAQALADEAVRVNDGSVRSTLVKLLGRAGECVALAARSADEAGGDLARSEALDRFERSYAATKWELLTAAVGHRISVDATDHLLAAASATRRLIQQLVKADRVLRTPTHAPAIEAEPGRGHGDVNREPESA